MRRMINEKIAAKFGKRTPWCFTLCCHFPFPSLAVALKMAAQSLSASCQDQREQYGYGP